MAGMTTGSARGAHAWPEAGGAYGGSKRGPRRIGGGRWPVAAAVGGVAVGVGIGSRAAASAGDSRAGASAGDSLGDGGGLCGGTCAAACEAAEMRGPAGGGGSRVDRLRRQRQGDAYKLLEESALTGVGVWSWELELEALPNGA
uniref:Uncharacterized protein n=1 Tax=Oryza sativa subsp. japonica TaxID=39947 RepID=Q6ZAX9_ORYSJ|nr:hypothetical protein [Oryza sativa Japonica Group]